MLPAGDQDEVELVNQWYKAPTMLPAGDKYELELVNHFHLILVTSR